MLSPNTTNKENARETWIEGLSFCLLVVYSSLCIGTTNVHDFYPERPLHMDTQTIRSLLDYTLILVLTEFHCVDGTERYNDIEPIWSGEGYL